MQYVRKRTYFRESNIIRMQHLALYDYHSISSLTFYYYIISSRNLSSYSNCCYTTRESFESVLPQYISYSPVLRRVPTDPVDPTSGLHLGSEMVEKAIRNCDQKQNVPWQKGNFGEVYLLTVSS